MITKKIINLIIQNIVKFLMICGFLVLLLPMILFIFVYICNRNWYVLFYVFISGAGILIFLTAILVNLRKTVQMIFIKLDANYKLKTNKELYSFIAWSCVIAFLFTIITYHIFIHFAILLWVYFVWFMIMFSKVWKFHGKKNIYLFLILISTIILSIAAAPFVRNEMFRILNFFGMY